MFQTEKGVLERIADSLERIASNLDIISGRMSEDQLREKPFFLPEIQEIKNTILPKAENVYKEKKTVKIHTDYDGVEFIRDFFADHGIIVQDYDNTNGSEYDQIAKHIGDQYEHIGKLYNELRCSISNNCERRTLDLLLTGNQNLTSMVNLGKMLDDYDFFEEYEYYKAPVKQMNFKHRNIGEKINFINGGWLEAYIYIKLKEIFTSVKDCLGTDFNYTILKNVKLKLSGGKCAEMDLFCEVNQNIYWFEAKSHNLDNGEMQKHFTKYDDYSKLLHLNDDRAFVIYTNSQNSYINRSLNNFPHLRILNHKEFPGIIRDLVRKELQLK
ncbi:MAG: hypothetical protein LWY06_06315 [Firmicutes bacterium]|nr:hypothetical protein [Bacillota bacterium]